MKHQRPKLYHYCGPNKTWIRCNVCNNFESTALDMEAIIVHIISCHPDRCYQSLDGKPYINVKSVMSADRLWKLRKQFPHLHIIG